METAITVIVDNVGHGELAGEWGLAMLVEHRGRRILVDTGATELFADNMRRLGLEVADVDIAVLSHAHYDHAGGMARFFADNAKARFYISAAAEENCYSKVAALHRYIGIPRDVLAAHADRIVRADGDLELYDGAWLVPHKTPGLAAIGEREKMYLRTEDGWRPDDFAHEQSLVVDTDKGLVIINCCSHGGAVNIINEVRATFPGRHVHGIIGGFHLYNKSDAEVRDVARHIEATGIEFVCTGHCTKERACGVLAEVLGERMTTLHAGLVMKF